MVGGYHKSAARTAEDERVLQAVVDRLNAGVAGFIAQYTPKAVKVGAGWQMGSLDGAAGQSLYVWAKNGYWKDYNAGAGRAGGSMLHFVAHHEFGGDIGKTVQHYKSKFGLDDKDPARIEKTLFAADEARAQTTKKASEDDDKKSARAFALWHGSRNEPTPLIGGTPAFAYLKGRGIDFSLAGKLPGAARYRPDVWCQHRNHRGHRDGYPAMLLAIYGLDGTFRGVHRTYLDLCYNVSGGWDDCSRTGTVRVVKLVEWTDGDGKKQVRVRKGSTPPSDVAPDHAKLKSHKASFGRFSGGHISLQKGAFSGPLRDIPAGTDVYVSEGAENGWSFGQYNPDARVIAGVSLDGIGALDLPPQMGRLIILKDNDAPGSDAEATFERVLTKLQSWRRAHSPDFDVALLPPPQGFKDWNDFLVGRGQ